MWQRCVVGQLGKATRRDSEGQRTKSSTFDDRTSHINTAINSMSQQPHQQAHQTHQTNSNIQHQHQQQQNDMMIIDCSPRQKITAAVASASSPFGPQLQGSAICDRAMRKYRGEVPVERMWAPLEDVITDWAHQLQESGWTITANQKKYTAGSSGR